MSENRDFFRFWKNTRYNTKTLKRRIYESIHDRTCAVWFMTTTWGGRRSLCSHNIYGPIVAQRKAIRYSMNSNDPWLHKSFTHIEHRAGRAWPRGFGALINSSPHFWIFTSVSVYSSPRSYLFTSAMGRIGVHFAPKYGTKPIRYVKLHFRDRRDAASLRYRNRATTTVLVCEQKPSPVWFSWRRKSCPVLREQRPKPEENISVFKNSRPICVDGALYVSIRRAFVRNLSPFLWSAANTQPWG